MGWNNFREDIFIKLFVMKILSCVIHLIMKTKVKRKSRLQVFSVSQWISHSRGLRALYSADAFLYFPHVVLMLYEHESSAVPAVRLSPSGHGLWSGSSMSSVVCWDMRPVQLICINRKWRRSLENGDTYGEISSRKFPWGSGPRTGTEEARCWPENRQQCYLKAGT